MAVNIKPLTKAELIDYFQVYRKVFPDWTVEHQVVLVRACGPIRQHIAFEALRSGDYRPSCSIRVVGPPDGAQLLHQYLDIKHVSISRREHLSKWSSVLKAMEEQFQPPVRKPLDIAEVLFLSEEATEEHNIDNVNNSTALAVMNAYLGKTERALFCCNRVEERATNAENKLAEWEVRKIQYIRELQQAIKAGKASEFLAVS
jgi:hypothetical protein